MKLQIVSLEYNGISWIIFLVIMMILESEGPTSRILITLFTFVWLFVPQLEQNSSVWSPMVNYQIYLNIICANKFRSSFINKSLSLFVLTIRLSVEIFWLKGFCVSNILNHGTNQEVLSQGWFSDRDLFGIWKWPEAKSPEHKRAMEPD